MRPIEWALHQRPGLGDAGQGRQSGPQPGLMTAAGQMPDDPVLHTAAMVYSSDTTVLDSIITTHGLSWGVGTEFRSHRQPPVWFHRQVDFSDWVLSTTGSPVAAESRGPAWATSSTGRARWWPRGPGRASSGTSGEVTPDAPESRLSLGTRHHAPGSEPNDRGRLPEGWYTRSSKSLVHRLVCNWSLPVFAGAVEELRHVGALEHPHDPGDADDDRQGCPVGRCRPRRFCRCWPVPV